MSNLWEDDELIIATSSAKSIREVFNKCGLPLRGQGYYYKKFHKDIKRLNIDISHFDQHHATRKNGITTSKTKIPTKMILVENSTYLWTSSLKLRLFKEGLLENKCAECPQGPMWNNKPLSLHLDHINGNPSDNRLENLRILCPNCHSQTETYSGKRNKIFKSDKLCECGANIHRTSKNCKSCAARKIIKSTKIVWPDYSELVELVSKNGYMHVARLLRVSDTAIRKRIQNYNKRD